MKLASQYLLRMSLIAALGATIVACNDDDNDEMFTGTSKLNVGVTDAPVDNANRVVVQFTGIEIRARQGEEDVGVAFEEPLQVDLLALQGSNQQLLIENLDIPAGSYAFMRLKVDAASGVEDSFIELDDGSIHSLFIPSGSQTGLQLNGPFTLEADAPTAFTIDFDLRQSVHMPQGQDDYFLRPTLRIIETAQAGHVEGTTTLAQLSDASCTNDLDADTGSAVYVYSGFDVTPDDVGSNSPQPVSSGTVRMDESGTFGFSVGYLLEGQYTAALTCQASDDDPQSDDDIAFVETVNFEVAAGQTTIVNFGASENP